MTSAFPYQHVPQTPKLNIKKDNIQPYYPIQEDYIWVSSKKIYKNKENYIPQLNDKK